MQIQEIELSIGESLVLDDHVLTLLDIESARALLRLDPRDADADSSSLPVEFVDSLDASRFAAPSLTSVPR